MIEKISDFYLFKRIVELGTLSAAAGDVGISAGSASLRLSAMEHNLGAQLFRRTTRQMNLTEAGKLFLDSTNLILNEISNYEEITSKGTGEISGKITVTAPADLGRNYISQIINLFLEEHPKVTIKLICTDRITDLTKRNIDIAVRYGVLRDSNLKIRRIASNCRIPVASPEYIKNHGRPAHPRDLVKHDCLLVASVGDRNNTWLFVENDEPSMIKVSGTRETNDGEIARRWAIEGLGITLKSAWDVAKDIHAGRLVPLLVDYCPTSVDLQLVFPPQKKSNYRVQLLSNHLIKHLKLLDVCLSRVQLITSKSSK